MSIAAAIPKDGHAGPADRGFDFLGYRFSSAGIVGVAVQAVERCVERMNRLYEQGADCYPHRGLRSSLVRVGYHPTKRAVLSDGLVASGFFGAGHQAFALRRRR
jgi:hypothetical protein